MPNVTLSQSQIDSLAQACQAAVDEFADFLDEDVRMTLAQALYAMNKPREAASIELDRRGLVSDERC
ncbi:MAG: hypothetical protein V3R26_04305 [Hyphomicrobium sp.]